MKHWPSASYVGTRLLGAAQRLLELGDGLVEQPHLLVRDAEVVVALVVLFLDVLGDALLELPEHVLEVRFLVAGRLLLLDDHARVLRAVVVAQPVAEVDELAVGDAASASTAAARAARRAERAGEPFSAVRRRRASAPASAKLSSAACARMSSGERSITRW